LEPFEFTEDRAGRRIKAPEDYWAFVPHPLPPPVTWASGLVSALSEADQALGRLDGIGRTLPNPHLLINTFIRREAVLSSRIEGTQADLADLLLFEVRPRSKPAKPDVVEVRNYVQAMEYGLKRLAELPLSGRLLREIHEHLMTGVRGQHMTPGEFRTSQNWIGKPGCSLNEATFVPPPPEEMKECLSQLEKYLNTSSDLPPLIHMAAIHYQFEAIHPFLDGNGRIGRLLITLLLCAESRLSQPLLYLSAYFEKHRDAYYDHLFSISRRGTWEAWFMFFLDGVLEQANDAIHRADQLLELHQEYHEALQTPRTSALPLKLVDALFESPIVTIRKTSEILDVTPAAAQAVVDKLIAAEILQEITGRKRDRIYVANRIMEIIN